MSRLFHFIFYFIFILSLVQPSVTLPLSGLSFSGDGTFYTVGLGSCGKKNAQSDLVAALSADLMKNGKYCGKKIKITTSRGSVTVTVVDTCPGCSKGSLDLSMSAFKKLGEIDAGRISINWSFL